MEDDFDIRNVRMPENEREYGNVLRSLSFHDFSGQTEVVKNPKAFVMAAHMRRGALDHVLLCRLPGLGETTLSNIIADELGAGFKVTSGPVLDKPGGPAGALTLLKKNDVFFIDGAHRSDLIVEEYPYSVMEDCRVDIVIDKGPSTHSIQIDPAPFTLIDATTRSGLLTNPLHVRFGINMHLEHYDMETLTRTVLRSTNILDVKCELNAAREIAFRSRGMPRIANVLLRRMCDSAQVKRNGDINKAITRFSLEASNTDRYSLDQIDNKLPTTIIGKFQGSPVGLATIATALDEDPGMLEEVYESSLIREGFTKHAPRDREATDLAYIHLGRSRVREQGFLFD